MVCVRGRVGGSRDYEPNPPYTQRAYIRALHRSREGKGGRWGGQQSTVTSQWGVGGQRQQWSVSFSSGKQQWQSERAEKQ